MGVVTQGAPVFTIGGDPGGIATRAAVMMDRANEFAEIHSSLSSLKADGWTGRAANRFREKYKLQLKGWLDAQEAFSSASTAYSTYASTLQSAQSQCDEIRSRWEQGRRAVEQAQNNKADARSRAQAEGGIPMIDASCDEGPGRATMQGAEEDFQALVNEVNEAGNQLNSVLDEGISKLPERTWLDAVSRTAGSFGLGVKDAVTDLFNLLFLGTPTLLNDFRRLITGGLTPEEFLVSYSDVPAEKLESFFTELSNNPQKFFEDAFYSLIDGETWADDPGRAFGRLAPDIALTYATAGAAAAAKGLKGAARAAFIGRELVLSVTHISDVSDLVRASRRLAGRLARIGSDAASGLAGLGSHLPHSGTTPHPHVPTAPTSPTGHSGTPTMPSSGAPSYPSHGAPSMPSTGAPSYGTGGTPSASTSPSYGSGSTPNTSGMSAPSHGNGGYSGNPSHGGVGAVDPNSRFAPPGQQNNGMSGATHSGEAGTTDPTSKYAPPTHQQNGTPGAAQPGTTPQASSAGTSGATTPAAGSHGTSGTASTGAGTATPTAGAHGNPSGPAHNGMAGEGVSAADGLPPRRNIDPDEPRNTSNNDFHSSADKGESYDAGNRKDSNHLNVDSRDFDKSSNGQYSPSNNSGSPQRGTGGTDELVGAGVGRSEASVGAQGSYERAGAFGGSDPSRVSHGADGFGGTADFGANAGHGGHGANGVTNSADTSGGLGSTPSSSHSTGSFTGHGAGHVGADSGTHSGSSTPAQGSYPAAGNSHGTSHADSGSGAGHSGSHQAGQGANGHSGASSSHDAPNTGSGAPKSEPPIPAPPKDNDPIPAPPKDNDPIPAPPKDNDPIPAPPKSEAPSSHSLSDTAHAPHTGADNAAGMQHADQSLGSANKADAPSTAMDEADLPTREIDGNAVRRRAGATAGNPDDFSWENNIANKSGKADNAGMPQHTSDPTVGADTHHAPHTGADGAADMSHAGHGDTGGHTADGKPHAADPTTPTHEADGATDAPATKNKFDELLGNPNTHGTTHAPNGTPQAADPTTPAHTADGSADVSTGNKYKDNYGSAEPDGSGHTTNPEGDLKKNPHHDTLNGNESPHSHHSADGDPKDTEIPTGDHSSNDKADNANSEHHANTTETEKPTSDSSHKDDNSTHNDGEEHSKDTQDKHSNKDDTETFEPDKDSADGAHDLTWDDIGGEHTDTDTLYERLYKEYGHKYSDEHARLSTEDWHNIEQAPPVYEVEERLAWATDLHKKHNLDIDGILLTNDYTAPKYEQINGALRDPDAVLSPEELVEISKRDDFLTTVPQFEGTVFRGFKMDEGKLVEILESGTFSDPAYLSTSRWDHVAESFMWKNALGKGEVRAMYEIRGASGADIGPVSFARHEGEVLMGRNSDYKIVSYEKYTDPIKNEPVYHVILEPKE
ncbi:MAG: ADP-ribosyltransferase [Actinomyces sp.]|nr:ADP-ribosyltransferase [Actinomyces sp.]